MSSINKHLSEAIKVRTSYVMTTLFLKFGIGTSADISDIEIEAYFLGMESPFSEVIDNYFQGTTLQALYRDGNVYSDCKVRDEEQAYGTEEEWSALSSKERRREWEEFHELCAKGTADDMYYYRVMMGISMANYVGH